MSEELRNKYGLRNSDLNPLAASPSRSLAERPYARAAIASATRSTFLLLSAATQMRPLSTA
jgi:hypothetical protein